MANFVAKKNSTRMTKLLRKAFEMVAEEFPEYEQDEFARWLIDAIESDEKRWATALNSLDNAGNRKLNRLVDTALARIRAGETEPLDLKKL